MQHKNMPRHCTRRLLGGLRSICDLLLQYGLIKLIAVLDGFRIMGK